MSIYITDSVLTPGIIQDLKNIKNCIVKKSIPYDQIMSEFQQYDYGFLPFPNTGQEKYSWPNKFSEYVFAGLPVICDYRLTNVANMVQEYQIGHIFKNSKLDLVGTYDVLFENVIKTRQKFHILGYIPNVIKYYKKIIKGIV